MKLTTVICTTPKRCELLNQALQSLSRQQVKPDEVLVVTDRGQKELVEEKIYKNIFIRPNLTVIDSGWYGLARARNKGVALSTGDIILFMDDDVLLPDQNLLFRVKEAFEENERLGIYGVQVKPVFSNSVSLPDKFNWIFGCTDDRAIRPIGAFMAVRREVFNVVGLFNENLGRNRNLISGEETELILRAKKYMNVDVVLDSRFKVYHIVQNRGWRYILKRAYAEGISKARFKNYDMSVERKYLLRYLTDPVGWIVAGATVFGYIVGKVRA